MTLATANAIAGALGNNSDRFVLDKASIANAVAGQLFSLWRATGQPGQAAIPTTPALCTKALLGSLQFDNQTAPATSYLGWASVTCGNAAMGIEFHDRIAHNGSLVLNVTTSQPITGLNLTAGGLNPPAARLGAANFSDGQWFLEVYADGGATASNATVNVTFDDGTSNNLNVIAVGGTLRAGRLIALTPFIQTADQGKYIRGINSVILSASTGTAGNFGFTYMRQRTVIATGNANTPTVVDWAALGFPEIPNDSCIQLVASCSTTSTGTVRGQGKIPHG